MHQCQLTMHQARSRPLQTAEAYRRPAIRHTNSPTLQYSTHTPMQKTKEQNTKDWSDWLFHIFFLCASRMERKWRVVMQANKIHYFISSPRMHYDNQSTEVLHSAHTKLSAHSAATNSAELIRNILLWWCCQAFTSRLLASTLELLLCYHLTSLVYIVHVVAGTSRDNSCLMCHVCKIFNSRDRCIWAIIKYIG